MKIYSEKKSDNKKRIKILGITVYKKENKNNYVIRKYIGGIFKSKRNYKYYKAYLLGIQIFKKSYNVDLWELKNQINNIEHLSKQIRSTYALNASILANIRALQVHPKTFGPYENINAGKDVVLICGGPSAKYFEYIDNAVYVAVNNSCLFRPEEIKFDYIFIQELHPDGVKNIQVNEYNNSDCIKFYGTIADEKLKVIYPTIKRIPQPYMKANNIKQYFLDDRHAYKFAYNLTTECIGDFGGTVFSAMQFILWTNSKRIYLVGADCSSNKNLFYKQSVSFDYSVQLNAWKKLKIFADDVYPDTEIISVNPVGLKGIFTDMYTNSYKDQELQNV